MDDGFRVLGPFEVSHEGRVLDLGGRRERAILAILVLHAGEVVSVERLIDGVWGDARPTSAKHMVHEYVSRLRRALAEVAPLTTRPPGYLLEIPAGSLDVRRFEELRSAARADVRAHRHDSAMRTYDRALALWRGDALSDITLEGDALALALHLDEERRVSVEERLECALDLGQHAQLIPQLERRLEQSPLRERTRAQLMLALYRAGRQSEALERYREGRALLVDETGIEPGRELRDLERAILRQDPALDLAAPSAIDRVAPSSTAPRRTGVGRHRALLVAGLVVVVLGVATIAGILLSRGGDNPALRQVDANSAGELDPGGTRLVDQVAVGAGPGRIVAGLGYLWIVDELDNTVSKVDPKTGSVQSIPVGADPTAIAVAAGFVWVTSAGTRSLDKIDPGLDRVVQSTPVGNGPSGVALGAGFLWVTNRSDGTVTKIDATTGTDVHTYPAGSSPSDIAYGFGALWIADEASATLLRFDIGTNAAERLAVGNGPESVAVGDDSIWVASALDGTVWRMDPSTGRVSHVVSVGSSPSSLLVEPDAVWVADSDGERIVRVDPATNEVAREIRVGNAPQGLAEIDGRVWLSARNASHAHRGGTLRISDFIGQGPVDAAIASGEGAWASLSAVGDGLVGFKRVGGPDGSTIVPDLATSLPIVTPDGLTYTFHLRPGIHYSNGQTVVASDFRRALTRSLNFVSDTGLLPSDFVGSEVLGGGSCSRAHCDLSRGVVTNDEVGTIVLHLRRPDPELFDKLALSISDPVPPGIPMTRLVRLGIPGTGPYEYQRVSKTGIVLVRNPRFREWSAAAQPDGYPDRIVFTYDESQIARDAQLTAVEQGRSDVMLSPPTARVREVDTRFAAQVHVSRQATTFGFFLNTRVPPFDNLEARQAVNFAFDRRSAIGAFGGVDGASITCQILPDGIAGFHPYCPYTVGRANSVWAGPDLRRARRLVAASGTHGEKVVVWTGGHPYERASAPLLVATLRKLGYRASLHVITTEDYFGDVYDSDTRAQAGFTAWQADYPTASTFLRLFSCTVFRPHSRENANSSELCIPSLDNAINRALTLQITDVAAANAAWAAIDRRITDLAAWVPLVNAKAVLVVSRRVGNVQSNPGWGVLIDQIWVR